MVDWGVKVPGADALLDAPFVKVLHELDETGLRLLLFHCAALDGADLFVRGLLLIGRKGVDVVEDIGGFGDGKGSAHLGEHVVLREAWEH